MHHDLMSTKPVPNFTSVEVRKEENLNLEGPSKKKKKEKNRSGDKTAEQMRKEEKERKNKAGTNAKYLQVTRNNSDTRGGSRNRIDWKML